MYIELKYKQCKNIFYCACESNKHCWHLYFYNINNNLLNFEANKAIVHIIKQLYLHEKPLKTLHSRSPNIQSI